MSPPNTQKGRRRNKEIKEEQSNQIINKYIKCVQETNQIFTNEFKFLQRS